MSYLIGSISSQLTSVAHNPVQHWPHMNGCALGNQRLAQVKILGGLCVCVWGASQEAWQIRSAEGWPSIGRCVMGNRWQPHLTESDGCRWEESHGLFEARGQVGEALKRAR